ncbi:aldo/keto reductase [Nocardiopsis exhalans]|uniref:Aryl-alcohol dehydrogenase-like predicted oxidoreductase n=2 Tax=Nocardiopsis TaxID=2013 RepID=A0A840W7W2_9ACTN|nr:MULTISPECIES: aldo/keto reductase [Nocardiopsis]MBB5491453.1 aryl-alcohol dehydrogenase-like predicted oxidoreductase [Nocardiopsis metallicus]USY18001.1 aldo/keto reductase [Nocardiopsis exhalans]
MRSTDPGVVLGLYRSRYERDLLEGALKLGVHRIDTSYNYLGFAAHHTLAQRAGDLLPELSISTKVGFFPAGRGGSEHSLDPQRLRQAVEESAEELGVSPDVVFLHNPEHTLARLEPQQASDVLADAGAELEAAVASGLTSSWGIASWNPQPLLPALEGTGDTSTPQVFMARSGLTVSSRTLHAIEAVTALWGLSPAQRWGMSPFAGHSTDPVWDQVNARMFLSDDSSCSNLAAAFRASYELPNVSRVAVGTNQLGHLRELLQAAQLPANDSAIVSYRALLATASTNRRRV